jgi:ankyrin repeat protein
LKIGNYDGCSALELAIASGNIECVRYLISTGANITTNDRWGFSPVQQSINNKYFDIALELESLNYLQVY